MHSKRLLALSIILATASGGALAQYPGGQTGPGGMGGPSGLRGGPGHGGPGGMMRHMDADGDGKVSQAEHQAATSNRFQKLDANNDGFVTQEEMQAGKARREEFRQKMQALRQEYQQR